MCILDKDQNSWTLDSPFLFSERMHGAWGGEHGDHDSKLQNDFDVDTAFRGLISDWNFKLLLPSLVQQSSKNYQVVTIY